MHWLNLRDEAFLAAAAKRLHNVSVKNKTYVLVKESALASELLNGGSASGGSPELSSVSLAISEGAIELFNDLASQSFQVESGNLTLFVDTPSESQYLSSGTLGIFVDTPSESLSTSDGELGLSNDIASSSVEIEGGNTSLQNDASTHSESLSSGGNIPSLDDYPSESLSASDGELGQNNEQVSSDVGTGNGTIDLNSLKENPSLDQSMSSGDVDQGDTVDYSTSGESVTSGNSSGSDDGKTTSLAYVSSGQISDNTYFELPTASTKIDSGELAVSDIDSASSSTATTNGSLTAKQVDSSSSFSSLDSGERSAQNIKDSPSISTFLASGARSASATSDSSSSSRSLSSGGLTTYSPDESLESTQLMLGSQTFYLQLRNDDSIPLYEAGFTGVILEVPCNTYLQKPPFDCNNYNDVVTADKQFLPYPRFMGIPVWYLPQTFTADYTGVDASEDYCGGETPYYRTDCTFVKTDNDWSTGDMISETIDRDAPAPTASETALEVNTI